MGGRSLAILQPSRAFRATRSFGSLRSTTSAVGRSLARAHRAARPTSSPPSLPPTRKRVVRGRASGESKLRGGRSRLVFCLAAAAVLTATAVAVTLSQLGGKTKRPTSPVRSSRLAATAGLTLTPTKAFDTVTNAIAKEDRQLTGRVRSPVRHHPRVATVRKRSTHHHSITHATVAAAASTSPASSTPSYSSSSSTAGSSSQPATSTPAAATTSSTSHQSQPAFGQNGSLGPGRGAPGTQ